MPAARASLASVAKRSTPAISPSSLAAVKGPKPGSSSSCGAIWATRSAISASRPSVAAVSSRRRRNSSRAMRTLAVCSARARRRAICVDHFFENKALIGSLSSGQRSCRCQSSVVVESDTGDGRGARGGRSRAAGRARRRPAARTATCRRLRAAPPARRRGHQCGQTCRARGRRDAHRSSTGRDADDALAAADEEPLDAPETCRQSSSAQTRSSPSERAQLSSARKSSSLTRMVVSSIS